MSSYLSKFITFLLLASSFVPLSVLGVEIENPLNVDSFEDLIDNLLNFIFYFAMGFAPIMIIIAGFYFITAAGDPEKIKTAKRIIIWTLVGLAIVISAKGLIELLQNVMGVESGTS